MNEARTLTDVSTDYAEAMKSFFVRFSNAIGSHRSVPCVGPIIVNLRLALINPSGNGVIADLYPVASPLLQAAVVGSWALNVSQWERKECGVLCISPRKGSILGLRCER